MYLLRALKNKERELSELILRVRNYPVPSTNDKLDIHRRKNSFQYYRKKKMKNGDVKRQYMKKEELEWVRGICQRDYNQKILKLAENELEMVRHMIRNYEPEELENCYTGLLEGRRSMVTPLRMPIDLYIQQWQENKKGEQNPYPNDKALYSDQGEHVRSKSEKILADKFYSMGIPYKYEAALELEPDSPVLAKRIIYPDFTLLNKRTGKEYYWEHLGMMDDADYAEEACRKIEQYESRGIFPGSSLLITFETKNSPLNMRIVEDMIQKYLL